jgi:outer membrane lipoprotein
MLSQALQLSLTFLLAGLPFLAGCAGSQLVPAELASQVSRDIPFRAITASPEDYHGRLVVLGGKVLNARRLKNETQLELLQLPLDETDRPIEDLRNSEGRFLAYVQEFLDPATLPAGTLVSLIGEAVGSKTMPLDDTEYRYPTVRVKTIKAWPDRQTLDYAYGSPWPYPYGPWPYPYWRHPWAPYPYWYP